MRRRFASGALGVLILLVAAAAPVDASKRDRSIYRDPLSYDGLSKAPRTKPAPLPTPVELSPNGVHPDVLVDEAGTAHITWNEERGDEADAAMYCRLKRGASGCDATALLTWEKTYGVGDGPQFNNDYGGPRIVRVGTQLLILSKRYPTIGDKPDGASSSTMLAWRSGDGGSTWSDAAIVGKRDLGQLTLVGPEDDPTILNIGFDPFCGMCVSTIRSGAYSAADGSLNTDPNSNYNGTVVSDGDTAIAGFNDLNPNIWLRRWNGADPVTDPANWSVSAPFPGDEPDLASGPAGTFLLARTGIFGPFQVRALSTNLDNTLTPGPPTVISDERGAAFGRLIQDPSGQLIAGWQQEGKGVLLRTSRSGASGFGSSQTLVDGDANGQIELGAAADGGGFAVVNRTGGILSPGQIQAVGFGTQAPTGLPGLGDIPGGGGDVSSQKIGFGSFAVTTAQGIFLNGTGQNARLVVTRSEINLHGLRIVPDPGTKIVIDPVALTIDTFGEVSVIASGPGVDFVLYHGVVKRDLKALKPGDLLFEFPIGEFKANLLGFDIAADIPVRLENDGVHIPIDIELPPELGGFTGHTELVSDASRGLHIDSINFHAGPIPLGALTIESIDASWMQGGTWSGMAELSVPAGGAIAAHIEFEDGGFAGAGFDYTLSPPATVGPFVYLLSVGGDFFLKPAVQIEARASLGAGAAFQGEAPVKVNGRFNMKFPSSGPASFALLGSVELFMLEVGNGFLEFQTDGYAQFGGNLYVSLGPVTGDATMQGFVDAPSGQFGADVKGQLQVCVVFTIPVVDEDVDVCGSVGAAAAVSNIGFAACAQLDPPDPFGRVSGGIEVRWEDINPAILYSPILLAAEVIESIAIPCSTGAFVAPPPRAAPAQVQDGGGQVVPIDSGLPTATILVKGSGGRPAVTVTGPGGEIVSESNPSAGMVVGVPGTDAVWVVLDKPAGGDWTVTADAGSPAITEILVSNGYKPPKVNAKLDGRSIDYRIQNLGDGHAVTFAESGRFGTHLLGTVEKPRGTLKFRPAGGAGGRRTVEALVEHDGVVTDQVRVGTFVAPPPRKPGRVGALRARKRGSVLTVTFRPPRGAARTEVVVEGAEGTRLAELAEGKERKLTFGAVKWERTFRIEARAFGKDGRAGPVRRITFRAKR